MIPIKVPPLGESIVEATISRWLHKEGDRVAAGDPIVELETDKITVEVPAPVAGVISRVLRAEGDVVKLDETLAEMDAQGAAADSPAAGAETALPAPTSDKSADTRPAAKEADSSASSSAPSDTPRASPAARKLASESGTDLADIKGSGRGGVISKPDVIEQSGAASRQPAANAGAASSKDATPGSSTPGTRTVAASPASAVMPARAGVRETREKMSTRRKRIAEHLLESQHSTAQLTTFNEVDMSAIMQLRERTRDKVEKEHGVKITFMPFFVKAACMALQSYPVVNAQIDGDSIVYRHYVNMGIAVASDQGLVVPNIRDADAMGLLQITTAMNDVAKRARDGKLTMDDLTGGTFTITNGGVFGSLLSTPIVNYPQSAILGLHNIQDRPVAIDGKVEIRPMMYLALSYDHRIVDGQQAVLYLVKVKQLLEDPASMLIT